MNHQNLILCILKLQMLKINSIKKKEFFYRPFKTYKIHTPIKFDYIKCLV